MTSLLFRNLLFTVLQPGIVAGLLPYLMLRDKVKTVAYPLQFYNYIGALIFLGGLIIMLHCIIKFAVEGRGTLSPIDPTRRLVVTGLYRFSRNPMYVGVLLILIGEAVFAPTDYFWVYVITVFFTFNLFILVIEEPRLRRDFAKEYEMYCQQVRRWL